MKQHPVKAWTTGKVRSRVNLYLRRRILTLKNDLTITKAKGLLGSIFIIHLVLRKIP